MRIYAASHMTSAKDQISETKMKFRYCGSLCHRMPRQLHAVLI